MTAGAKLRSRAESRNVSSTNDKHEIFVQEYLKHFNATKAAIAAGYSAKTAGPAGARLLSNVRIAEKIRIGSANRVQKLEITGEKILSELAKIAFITDSFDPAFGSLEFKTGDKVKALEMLGRWHEIGLWKETLEVKRAPDEQSSELKESLSRVKQLFNQIKIERGGK